MSASGPRTRALARRPGLLNRSADQELLREVLWPTIRTSVLMHGGRFSFGERRDVPGSRPFFAALPAGDQLGCEGCPMVGTAHRSGCSPPAGGG